MTKDLVKLLEKAQTLPQVFAVLKQKELDVGISESYEDTTLNTHKILAVKKDYFIGEINTNGSKFIIPYGSPVMYWIND